MPCMCDVSIPCHQCEPSYLRLDDLLVSVYNVNATQVQSTFTGSAIVVTLTFVSEAYTDLVVLLVTDHESSSQ